MLSKLKSSNSVEIEIALDDIDLTKSESKATYEEIKRYVLENYSFEVSTLYIAQVKRKYGLIERENYNIGDGKGSVPKAPPEKEKAIENALKFFQMI
ncbi:putative RNA methyltransferase [anaerobic digester metagenome]